MPFERLRMFGGVVRDVLVALRIASAESQHRKRGKFLRVYPRSR